MRSNKSLIDPYIFPPFLFLNPLQSHDEFNAQHTIRVNQSELLASAKASALEEPEVDEYETLPTTFDWRQHMPMNKIENQGQCGACWAFSSAFTVEAQYAIKQQKILHLSKQELIDCSLDTYDHEYKNHGCHAGFAAEAFKYIIKHGIQEDQYYSYKMKASLVVPLRGLKKLSLSHSMNMTSHKLWPITARY